MSDHVNPLVSGALSGLVCDMVMHPMDTVRTRLMMQEGVSATHYKGTIDAFSGILRSHGVRSLYKGAGVVWSFTVPAHALYFGGYEVAKRWIQPGRANKDKSAWAHFAAGFFADVCGAFLWTPMDVIKQRQQAQVAVGYATVPDAVKTILKDAGPKGLFKGLGAALAAYGPFVGLYFVIYEQWKRSLGSMLNQDSERLPFAAHLVGGAVAGSISAYVTTPLDVIKTRLQTSVDASGRPLYSSARTTLTTVLAKEGASAFMKGASARVLWIAPGTAITIAAYEWFKTTLDAHGFPAPNDD